jgi:hypothetical protein
MTNCCTNGHKTESGVINLTDADIGKKFRLRNGKVITLYRADPFYPYRKTHPYSIHEGGGMGVSKHGFYLPSGEGTHENDVVARVDEPKPLVEKPPVETLGPKVRSAALRHLADRLHEMADEIAAEFGISSEAVLPTLGLAMTEYGISGMFQLAGDWSTEKAAHLSSSVADALGQMALAGGGELYLEIPPKS